MNFFSGLTLAGGLAMFLYGMRLMGDGLKQSSSGTLKQVMEKVTNNTFKAFLLGVAVTAIIQSSTATIVITSGLVGAGLLTLRQSLGIIIGANVGTTVTGQIIRLLDMDAGGSWLQIFQPSSLAPIALIIGIVMIMAMADDQGSFHRYRKQSSCRLCLRYCRGLCAPEFFRHDRYPSGLLILRPSDLARNLSDHRGRLSGRLRDDRNRMFNRRQS